MGFIDLHAHTTYSDGSLSPSALIALADEKSLDAIAITDHDSIDGLAEAEAAAQLHGIELVNGVEVATYYGDGIEIHLLGLLIDSRSTEIKEKLSALKKAREQRNIEIFDRLEKLGFAMNLSEMKTEPRFDRISRAHFALYLYDKGYVSTTEEAFRKYLSPGGKAYVRRPLLQTAEIIAMIKNAGGVPVLAHPTLYGLDFPGIEKMIVTLKGLGLAGIEAIYSMYTVFQEAELRRLAKKYDLSITGGSDFHGEVKKNIGLGIGRGRLRVPYSVLEDLRHQLKSSECLQNP